MKQQNTRHAQNRILGSALLLAGLAVSAFGTTDLAPVRAELWYTEQGSHIGIAPAQEMLLRQQEVVLSAAPENEGINVGLIVFGAMMMLIGFGLHALIVLRTREETERTVPVRRTQKAFPRTSRKQMEVIWVERTIRL